MIYCNSKVVLVDFKVRETKSYSIFIEEELCEIGINRQKDRFVYGFDINKEADTPLNRKRKAIDKKHLKQGVGFLAGLGLLVFIAVTFLGKLGDGSRKPNLAALLAASGKETNAKVFLSDPDKATYNFVANGKVYSKQTAYELGIDIILENGMPLEDGDEFLVNYSSQKPEYHIVHFNRPTAHQIGIYKKRATKKYQELHPRERVEYCDCLTEVAYNLDGINGYAKFYLQDQEYSANPRYNEDSFHRLVRSIPFQKEVDKRCWELK